MAQPQHTSDFNSSDSSTAESTSVRSRWTSSLSSGYSSNNGSIIGRNRPTAESTRKEILSTDPFIAPGSVLPRSVQCSACGKSIRLGSKTTYALANWHRHRDLTCSDVGRLRAQGMGSQEPHMTLSHKGAPPGGSMEDDSWQTFTSHFQVDLDSGKHTLLPDIPLKGEGSKASYLSTIIQLDSHSSSPEDKSTTPKKIRRLSQASDHANSKTRSYPIRTYRASISGSPLDYRARIVKSPLLAAIQSPRIPAPTPPPNYSTSIAIWRRARDDTIAILDRLKRDMDAIQENFFRLPEIHVSENS